MADDEPAAPAAAPAVVPLIIESISMQSNFGGEEHEDAHFHFLNYQDHITELQQNSPDDAPIFTIPVQINKFRKTLKNKARRWMDNRNWDTIEDLRRDFIAEFGKDPTRNDDIRALTTDKMKPNESVQKYSSRLRDSAARLNFPNELLKDIFIAGLPESTEFWVRGQRPRTFDEACRSAKEHKAMIKARANSTQQGLNVSFNVQDQESEEPEFETDDMQEILMHLRDMKTNNVQGNKPGYYRSPSPHVKRTQQPFVPPNQQWQGQRQFVNGPTQRFQNGPTQGSQNFQGQGQGNYYSKPPSDYGKSQNPPSGNYYPQGAGNNRSQSPGRQNYAYPQGYTGQGSNYDPYQQNRGRSPSRNQDQFRPNSPARGKSPSGHPRKCWACGQYGHMWKDCANSGSKTHRQVADLEAMRMFLKKHDEHFH